MSSKAQSEIYDGLIRRLERAICGDYPTWTMHADALLRVIGEATETDTRRMLWESLITRFRLIAHPPDTDKNEQPVGAELSDEICEAVCERMKKQVVSFVQRLLEENRSPASTAARLMQFMGKLASADERCVALSIVLRSQLVPYAQIPSDLFAHPFPDIERLSMSEDVLQALAVMSRVIRDPKRKRSDDFAALAYLVIKARNDQDAQTIIAYAFACWRWQLRSSAESGPSGLVVGIPLEGLGEAVGAALSDIRQELNRQSDRDCGNPNCPRHGTPRKPKADKPS